jgi:hypothetical protein
VDPCALSPPKGLSVLRRSRDRRAGIAGPLVVERSEAVAAKILDGRVLARERRARLTGEVAAFTAQQRM